MAVLYRKYRPQTFSEVLNQKPIITTLKNQVKTGQVAHAYLFTGSRGVGKTSVARIFAKAVNCLNAEIQNPKSEIGDGDACGVCSVCKQIEAGNFMDLVEIDAASNTGVDNIRELIEHVKFAPSVGKYKVFIIDEVHMLSKGAFNALLKTLEEPPAHAIFILATTEVNKVPATIISRTQRFDFKAYSSSDLMPLLERVSKAEGVDFSSEVLEVVSEAAEGSARDALSLLDKILTLGSSATLEETGQLLGITDIAACENLLELLVLGEAAKLPNFFGSLMDKGLDFKIFDRDFLEYLRKALVYKVAGNFSGLSKDHENKLKGLTLTVSANDLIFIIRLFLRSYKELDSSPSPQLPMLLAGIEATEKKSKSASPSPKVISIPQPASPSVAAHREEQPLPKKQDDYQGESIRVVITMEEAQNLWPKVIAQVKQINGPLSSLLRKSHLLEPANGKIILGVKFLFDKQSLETAKNIAVLHEVLEKVFGKNVGIRAEVVKESDQPVISSADAVSQALQVFGGEVIQ